MRDVLALPVALLRGMPAATTLALRLAVAPDARVVFTTSGTAYNSAARIGAAPFAPDEYEAVALAVELERADAQTFAAWCRAKFEQPFTLTARAAMGGAEGLVPHYEISREVRVGRGRWEMQRTGTAPRDVVQRRTTLTFGELLERISAELVDVKVHAGPTASVHAAPTAPVPGPRAREAGGETTAPAMSPSAETFTQI